MAEARALELSPQQIEEISLVDLAYLILKSSNEPHNYRDLMQEVARNKGLTEEQVNEVIARLYTEINIDGRFICIGSNVWGLKRWYPTDKAAPEKAAGGKKFVRKDIDEDDDDFYDEDDDDYADHDAEEDEALIDYDDHDDEEEEEEDLGDHVEDEEEDFDDDEEAVPDLEEEEDIDNLEEEEDDF